MIFFCFVPVRGAKPGKSVQLTDNEIRGLCLKLREIFLSQPILLELKAPLKVCGEYEHPVYTHINIKFVQFLKLRTELHI